MKRNKSRLAKMLFCLTLALGVFSGAPMRPDEIEELLFTMNQPKIELVVNEESGSGNGGPLRSAGAAGSSSAS